MTLMNVNLWSVLVAGIATMVVGFLWYSPMLFARPWMVAMGYDPEDKARMQEMQKSAGKSYAISFVASLVSAFILAKIIHVTTVNTALYGMKIGFAIWLGVCDDGTAHGKAIRQPVNQALFDQYRVSVGVLSGDGSDSGGVAAMNQSSSQSSVVS